MALPSLILRLERLEPPPAEQPHDVVHVPDLEPESAQPVEAPAPTLVAEPADVAESADVADVAQSSDAPESALDSEPDIEPEPESEHEPEPDESELAAAPPPEHASIRIQELVAELVTKAAVEDDETAADEQTADDEAAADGEAIGDDEADADAELNDKAVALEKELEEETAESTSPQISAEEPDVAEEIELAEAIESADEIEPVEETSDLDEETEVPSADDSELETELVEELERAEELERVEELERAEETGPEAASSEHSNGNGATAVGYLAETATIERLGNSTSLARWSAAVAAAHDGCFVLDPDGLVVSVSVAAIELLGFGDTTVIGRHVLDVVNLVDLESGAAQPEYAPRITPLVVLDSPGLARSLMRVRHDDGAIVTLDSSSAPIHDAAGELLGSMTFISPIPAR
jgi:PAS domain S-box-containing protein